MNTGNPTEENHCARSSFVRGRVQRSSGLAVASSVFARKLPKRIVQFWAEDGTLMKIDTFERLEEEAITPLNEGTSQRRLGC